MCVNEVRSLTRDMVLTYVTGSFERSGCTCVFGLFQLTTNNHHVVSRVVAIRSHSQREYVCLEH